MQMQLLPVLLFRNFVAFPLYCKKVTNYQSFHFTGLISVQICFFQFSSPQLLSMGQLTITSLPQKLQGGEKFSRYTIYRM